VFVGTYETHPCLLVDSGTMADFLDESDADLNKLVQVFVFDAGDDRDAYLDRM
jgi:hypothetical protein